MTNELLYQGFEQGPIRPPSEARSLLIRVTRNCPWNRCTFCPVYKNTRFSIRSVDHIIKDIDALHKYVMVLQESKTKTEINDAAQKVDPGEYPAFEAAAHWFMNGMHAIFIQDANSLVIKPAHIIQVLEHLKARFPLTKRITSYARSDTIARIKDQDLKAVANAGLNRIHIGLESGSDRVLEMVQKGVTKAIHIKAGHKVKAAGMELSEYVMPGLGGKLFSEIHAAETADALNQINPHFIRLRTLAISSGLKLYDDYRSGIFQKNSELMTVREIRLFIEKLQNITSIIKSDHILNLFQDLEGKLPEAKENMLHMIDTFLGMAPDRQCLYQVGRRIGIFNGLKDMDDERKLAYARDICTRFSVTPGNVDALIEEQMRQFV
jgi:histone acetyltransferase (RNA polymerase elongator complex component)